MKSRAEAGTLGGIPRAAVLIRSEVDFEDRMLRQLLCATGAIMVMVTVPCALAAPPQAGPAPESAGGAGTGGPAAPGEADVATRNAARKIAEEGLALFDGGKYAEALDRFDRAGALVRAPTMGLMAARSLVKLGRLVEASERYLAVTKMKLEADASDAFRKAQVDAAKEREALEPRIPGLLVAFAGAAPGATVMLDGKPLPAALIGAALPLEPGPHTVVVTQGTVTKTERLQIKEGEQRRLVLDVAPPPSTSSLRVGGIIGLTVGGVGLIAGAVVGGLAMGADADLSKKCPNKECPAGSEGELGRFETMKAATTASLITGGIMLGGGALMLGLAPSKAKQAGVQPVIGVGSAGVKVVF